MNNINMKDPFTKGLEYELDTSTFMTRHWYLNFCEGEPRRIDHQYPLNCVATTTYIAWSEHVGFARQYGDIGVRRGFRRMIWIFSVLTPDY